MRVSMEMTFYHKSRWNDGMREFERESEKKENEIGTPLVVSGCHGHCEADPLGNNGNWGNPASQVTMATQHFACSGALPLPH